MPWGFRVQEGWPLSVPALVRGRNLQISSQEEEGYHTDSLGTDSSNQRQSFPFLKLLPQARSWLRHPPLQPSELDLPAQAERLVPTPVSKTQHFSCRKKFVPAATSSLLRSVAPGTCCCRNPRLKGSAAPEAGDSRDLRLQVSRPFEGMRSEAPTTLKTDQKGHAQDTWDTSAAVTLVTISWLVPRSPPEA